MTMIYVVCIVHELVLGRDSRRSYYYGKISRSLIYILTAFSVVELGLNAITTVSK